MKKFIFLLIIALFGMSTAMYSQSHLPLKNSFSLGGGLMWSINNSEGDFQDVAGNPTSAMFGLEYRHYFKNVLGLEYLLYIYSNVTSFSFNLLTFTLISVTEFIDTIFEFFSFENNS